MMYQELFKDVSHHMNFFTLYLGMRKPKILSKDFWDKLPLDYSLPDLNGILRGDLMDGLRKVTHSNENMEAEQLSDYQRALNSTELSSDAR